MAKYGSDKVTIEIKDAADGAGEFKDISSEVLEFNGIDVQAESEEGHGFGESWVKNLYTGLKRGDDVTLKGFYDDTATTGTDALLNRVGTATELKITWGGAKTTTASVLIKSYKRLPSRGELTKYECAMAITGEIQEG